MQDANIAPVAAVFSLLPATISPGFFVLHGNRSRALSARRFSNIVVVFRLYFRRAFAASDVAGLIKKLRESKSISFSNPLGEKNSEQSFAQEHNLKRNNNLRIPPQSLFWS
ncbi:MAG: hypothetical protein ABSA16_02400 [Thermoguttaceae bacterium]|jgi:hypothetical protein